MTIDNKIAANGEEPSLRRFPLRRTLRMLRRVPPKTRTQIALEKERRAEESRKKHAELLRPNSLSERKRLRLVELKRAKIWHEAQRNEDDLNASSRGEQGDTLEGLTLSLHRHKSTTRMAVVSILIGLLFTVGHSQTSTQNLAELLPGTSRWFISLMEAFVAVLQASLSATVHFVLCDVQLVYALEGLQFGMKTGNDFKRYYDNKTRWLVASISGSFLLIGFVKALSAFWFHELMNRESSSSVRWEEDALVTCRALFEYSAIFLTLILTFMNQLASSYRYDSEGETPQSTELKNVEEISFLDDSLPSVSECSSASSDMTNEETNLNGSKLLSFV